MTGRIEGKVCVITGASSGIGAAAARLFAAEGGKVVLAARRDKTQDVADAITTAGGEAIFIRTDVLNLSDIDNVIAGSLEAFGRIDVFFGNAGVGNFFAIEDMDLEKDFYCTIDTFMRANWWAAKRCLPIMVKQGKGDFIFTASTAAYNGVAMGSVYAAGKAGLLSLSRSLAMGYGKYNIRSNVVVPGLTTTELSPAGGAMEKMQRPFIPMGRAGTAEEVAYAALFFASDECRYATGTELIIDGGGDHLGVLYPQADAGAIDNEGFNIAEGGVTKTIE
ncbi:MAG: SDR family oxidoreductase [Coriobacteriales bacterium]|jgi:NAD(P)-dependent dehydrogenase (short-subunit alcohol dehydrogenase family)|nr:SDR family oxidoreductase [Coriobacteriales bacterium]